jgi:predicted nucleotidyltransferase
MLEALFSSKARVKLLRLLLLNPGCRYYLRELAQKTGLPVYSVQVEVKRLTEAGILEKEISGRQTYYTVNEHCPIVPELRSIFIKTTGIADVLKASISKLSDRINYAFIYGSFAKGTQTQDSDVDIMVIGDVTFREAVSALRPAQDDLGREVNPSVYSLSEFGDRVRKADHFISTVLDEPKIFIVGDEDGFRADVQEWLAG